MFINRKDAGQQLASRLRAYAGRSDVLVLALPRGGVPVAYEVARALHAPLDVFIVRKIGVPAQEELAMGAIATGGIVIRNEQVIRSLHIRSEDFERIAALEKVELARREREYLDDRPPHNVEGRIVILVDDGIATGASMQAAAAALRSRHPQRLIVAASVGAPPVVKRFASLADEVVLVEMPEDFYAVGAWYQDFAQTTDQEVSELLNRANAGLLQVHNEGDTPPALR